jgi:proline iminopeptidase
MLTFYPQIKPYVKHSLEVDRPHILYVEECGNPHGLPVVFLHGGPGAGCEPYHRRFFDPDTYRIVLFDQRGCGRSSPHAELEGNTTQALVADIETIRRHLGIDKWVVFGGSWGSTLALVYAETHPDRVSGLILRGIFLCRPDEIAWFYQRGADRIFPDYWEDYISIIPEEERHDMVQAYYRRLTSKDELARMAAAKAWSRWEGRAATLRGRKEVIDHYTYPYNALSLARIECHYFVNDSFLAPNQILDNAGALTGIPGEIVHGRYDMVCPVENAWQMHRAWPSSELHIISDAGHSATEKGNVDALIRATNRMAKRLA